LPEKELTMILLSANNVNWAKQPLKVQLNVIRAILECLVKPTVSAKIVRPGSIKIQRANRNALNVKQDYFTPVLKLNAVAVI
jgi:hypothetical protein